jgi:hypothetical protein
MIIEKGPRELRPYKLRSYRTPRRRFVVMKVESFEVVWAEVDGTVGELHEAASGEKEWIFDVGTTKPSTHLICSQVRHTASNCPVYAGQELVNPDWRVEGSQVQILSSRRSESAR